MDKHHDWSGSCEKGPRGDHPLHTRILAEILWLQIVELLNIVYCLAELTEFAAFIALRIKAPDLRRPYRIPLPTWACALMLLPASLLLAVILIIPVIKGDWQVFALDCCY